MSTDNLGMVLANLCPRCGSPEFVLLPGRAPRCKHCDAVVGLAPKEGLPRPTTARKRPEGLPRYMPSGNSTEDAKELRRRRQVANQRPARMHELRPISPERTRLDLRLSVDMRDQLNDLVSLHAVTASEIVRRAVEMMWADDVEQRHAAAQKGNE